MNRTNGEKEYWQCWIGCSSWAFQHARHFFRHQYGIRITQRKKRTSSYTMLLDAIILGTVNFIEPSRTSFHMSWKDLHFFSRPRGGKRIHFQAELICNVTGSCFSKFRKVTHFNRNLHGCSIIRNTRSRFNCMTKSLRYTGSERMLSIRSHILYHTNVHRFGARGTPGNASEYGDDPWRNICYTLHSKPTF